MYLITGNSVCVFVHGFEPYFYVEAPTATFSPDDCQALADLLNVSYHYLVLGLIDFVWLFMFFLINIYSLLIRSDIIEWKR